MKIFIYMVAYFRLHLSDINVDMPCLCVDLSVIYVDLSDHYVDMSEKNNHNKWHHILFYSMLMPLTVI